MTFIIYISFYGVDRSVRCLLHNSNMIRFSVTIPVEEYNISGFWSVASVPPPFMLLKPRDSLLRAGGKFGKSAVFQQCGLIRTPGNKTSAPIHMGIKAIPSPVWFASHISQIGTPQPQQYPRFVIPRWETTEPTYPQSFCAVREELTFLLG